MKRYTKVKHGNEHVYRIEERNELYCNERMRSSQKKDTAREFWLVLHQKPREQVIFMDNQVQQVFEIFVKRTKRLLLLRIFELLSEIRYLDKVQGPLY